MSSNFAQMPDWQSQPTTELPAAPEAGIRQVDEGSPAKQDLIDHAWQADASPGNPEATEWAVLRARTAEQADLTLRVCWSEQAERDLKAVVTAPAVRDQLRHNAEAILHDIVPEWRSRCVDLGDAGSAGQVMWHRGVPHEDELLPEQGHGAGDYFLFYQRLSSALGFEVLGVRSIYQVARRWERRSRNPLLQPIRSLKRRLPWGLRW